MKGVNSWLASLLAQLDKNVMAQTGRHKKQIEIDRKPHFVQYNSDRRRVFSTMNTNAITKMQIWAYCLS